MHVTETDTDRQRGKPPDESETTETERDAQSDQIGNREENSCQDSYRCSRRRLQTKDLKFYKGKTSEVTNNTNRESERERERENRH